MRARRTAAIGAVLFVSSAACAAATPAGFDCMLEARQDISVRSPVEGIIESVAVERGSYVKRGQQIATLVAGPQRAALALARSRAEMQGELKAAEARVELARKKLARAEDLVKNNFVSADAKDEAHAEHVLANEQLRVARDNQRLAELEAARAEEIVSQYTIRSPINGFVAEVVLRPGELSTANQNEPIVRMVEVDPLNVELVLPVTEFGKFSIGQRAKVTVEPPLNKTYDAAVEVVDRVVDAASGTFGIRLRLPNPGGSIPAGVKCRARF